MRKHLAGALAVVSMLAFLAPVAQASAVRPTERWLVVLERPRDARAPALVARLLDRAGVRRAGPGAPSLGVLTVRGPRAAVRRLRADPAVASVSREWTRRLRRVPNDPALSTLESEYAVPADTAIQWALARQGFPTAWDVTTGAQARVAVLDTGVDGGHPELAGKIASAEAAGALDPLSDSDGHGTHVSGLACAATDDGRGVAGAGWGCRLHVIKLGTDLTDGIPDENIVRGMELAIAHSPHAINMSFGGGPESAALGAAIQAAYDRGIVIVAAAANDDGEEDQGAPASQLQPGDAANLDAGRGLVVTAAEFDDTNAGGRGSEVSMAAYGLFDERRGPPGVISTYPARATFSDVPSCTPRVMPACARREIGGQNAYAYQEGTSMAAPQVAALAALVGALNPHLSAAEKLRLIKLTARRSGGWTSDLGWGILNAGAAIEFARRIDRIAPASRVRAARRRVVKGRGKRARAARRRARRRTRLAIRAVDPGAARGLLPMGVTGVDLYGRRGKGRVRRLRRLDAPRTVALRLRPGVWRFHTRAIDGAGNAERAPRRPDLRLRVRRR